MKHNVRSKLIGIMAVFVLALVFSGIQVYAAGNDAQIRDAGTVLNHVTTRSGERFTMNVKADGGTGEYRYKYSYTHSETGSGRTTGYIKASVYSFTVPEDPAFYVFRVSVKDSEGNILVIERPAAVTQDTGSPLSVKGSVSSTRLPSDGSITASVEASGGTAPYLYRFAYISPDGKRTELSEDYSFTSEYVFDLKGTPGVYTVAASAKDSTGRISEKRFKVTTYPITVKNSVITKTVTYPGDKITLTSKPEYAIGNVKYHYSYHLEGRPWVFLGDYVQSEKKVFSFSYGGTFYVRVGAKDERGRYSEKQFKISVRSLDISASRVSADTVSAGSTVKLTASASNSYGKVKYHYSYHAQGKPWSFIGDYTSSPAASLRFGDKGVYYFRVGAKDDSGRYIEKQFRILVYDKTARKTIKGTNLMASSEWASKSMGYLPAGSAVNVITGQGRWFMVRSSGKTGWLYNLSMGSYRNYTTVDEKSIDSIADDIIFAKGKAIKGLFDEVAQYSYKATNDFGYEKNIAYIIKYRRGACYQHTAYLDYLLSRAGYDTKMVTDGKIKREPKWTLHTWVIVKTESGWRHIDATRVRETGCAYLKDDAYLSKYVWWDAKKYPVCK